MLSLNISKFAFLFGSRCLQSTPLNSFRWVSFQGIQKSKITAFRMSPNVFRQPKTYSAKVHNLYYASKDIIILELYVSEPDFSFKAGQWVDFYIPGIKQISGYSITSAPHEVRENRTFNLAVKYSAFEPTCWVHTECKAGSVISVKVGGDFVYNPEETACSNLLLIGGGVGINPLVSILSHHCYTNKLSNSQVQLLYSAKTDKDLIFKEEFSMLEKVHENVNIKYFLTNSEIQGSTDSIIKYHRISESDVADSLEKLQKNNLLCYICGPLAMIDHMENMLLKLGVKSDLIKYEKWW